jgi:hypothetical protein
MTAEKIKERMTVEDFQKMIEHVSYDRFEGLFKYKLSETYNFEDVFNIYKICHDLLINNLTENLYFFSSGCTFESYNLTTENGTPITKESDRDDVFNALNKDFEDRHKKLELIFLQYGKKIIENTDFPKKELSKNITETKSHVSETIELMIRKNILLPKPDPETGQYIPSGSTPDTVAWVKMNGLCKKFPHKLFHAVIKTNYKPWIIAKYYRDT